MGRLYRNNLFQRFWKRRATERVKWDVMGMVCDITEKSDRLEIVLEYGNDRFQECHLPIGDWVGDLLRTRLVEFGVGSIVEVRRDMDETGRVMIWGLGDPLNERGVVMTLPIDKGGDY